MTTADHRPQHLDEMIGQNAIKQRARIAIQAALERGEPLQHLLLTSAGGGLGKSSFAAILANECFSPLVSTTGQCLMTPTDLRNLLIRIKPNTILMVDEFHGIGRSAAEELLLVLEDGILNLNTGRNGGPIRIDVPPFTLCAATTAPECLSAPLTQRMLRFHFDFYTDAEVAQIVEGIFLRWDIRIDRTASGEIAGRSRGVPRRGLRLAERTRDLAQAIHADRISVEIVTQAMRIEGIDHIGLDQQERGLLHILDNSEERPVSARTLALSTGVSVATIQSVEPELVRLGLMAIGTGGRRLTEEGRQHLQSVAKEVV